MTRTILVILLLANAQVWAQQKAVFIIVDGIPADVIEKLKPPTLFEIAGDHGYSRAYVGGEKGGYSQSPTISAVGYNHVLTGTWTNKHNVWDNDIKDPNYHYWNVFRIATYVKPEIKTAIFSTWLDNRTKLVGDQLPAAGNVKIDYAFDGYENDTVRFPHAKGSQYISDIDDLVATEAANTIATKAPDLSWVYLEFTDDMGHAYGDSPQFYDAIKTTDERLSRIWRAIQARQREHGEDWLVVVTTDHGRTAANGKGHGGQSDRERNTWIITNSAKTNERFRSMPAAVDIAPTVLRHLGISPPDHVMMEMDGIPLIGDISLYNLKAIRNKGTLYLQWRAAAGARGNAEVFMASTNHYSTGQPDDFTKVATADITRQSVNIPMPKMENKKSAKPSSGTSTAAQNATANESTDTKSRQVFKFVIKAADNWATAWWVAD